MSLGIGAIKGWKAHHEKTYKTQQGGFHGHPVIGGQSGKGPPTSTYLTKNLSWPDS